MWGHDMTENTHTGGMPDLDDPDEFAESVPIDPTPQEVDEYQERLGKRAPGPR